MRFAAFLVALIGIAGIARAQGRSGSYSLGGFGSVIHPGLGHTPTTPPGGINGPYFYSNGFAGRPVGAAPRAAAHPQHGRTVVVPYPVYYGYSYPNGYASGYYDSSVYAGDAGDPGNVVNSSGVPSVVINQNFVPQTANPQVREYNWNDNSNGDSSGFRMYQAPVGSQPAARQPSDQPTLYLIAFKDHSIVQALGYWMEGSTLHYVSAEHTLNQASLDMIDHDMSMRLNSERGVEFRIPQTK